MPNFDPIAAMDARHAAQKAAEEAQYEEQNRQSALATEQARLERDPELRAVDAANKFQVELARMPSDKAQAFLEEHGQSPEAYRLLREADEFTDEEFEELAEAMGYDVTRREG